MLQHPVCPTTSKDLMIYVFVVVVVIYSLSCRFVVVIAKLTSTFIAHLLGICSNCLLACFSASSFRVFTYCCSFFINGRQRGKPQWQQANEKPQQTHFAYGLLACRLYGYNTRAIVPLICNMKAYILFYKRFL